MNSFYEENKELIDAYLEKFASSEDFEQDPDEDWGYVRNLKEFIFNLRDVEDRKPFFDELIRFTSWDKETLNEFLSIHNLTDEVDTSFNSKLIKDIYDAFPGAETNVDGIVENLNIELLYREYNLGINVLCSYENDIDRVDKKHAQCTTISANNNGIRLINIFDYELLDEEVKARVYRMLSDILNKPLITAWARHTKVKVIDYAEARDFLNLYHIQGAATATVYLGSFYKDELVGVMTFGKPRFSKGYDYEIVRLAWKTGVRISGGTQKIFKYFVKNFEPESIMTYADINKFTGNGYLKLGYKLIQITDPDYKWVSYDSREALTRYKCQKHRLIQKGWGTIEQTEDQIMVSHGYYKVYGSGNIMLDWVKDRKVDTNVKVELNNTPTKNNSSVPKKTYNGKLSSLSNFI